MDKKRKKDSRNISNWMRVNLDEASRDIQSISPDTSVIYKVYHTKNGDVMCTRCSLKFVWHQLYILDGEEKICSHCWQKETGRSVSELVEKSEE